MKNIRYVTAAAIAGALSLAGCTAAEASSTAAASGTAKAGASNHVAPPILTHITAYNINTDAPLLSSVVSGATIGDSGPAEQVPPGSTLPTKHADELLLNLARGTFRLNIAGIDTEFTKALGPANIPGTCSDYVSVSANVPIVPGSGTGAYRGIAGTFAATLTVNELHHTPCNQTVTTFRQLIWLNGAGTITLP